MRTKLWPLLIIVLAGAIASLPGCSDDDDDGNPTEPTPENPFLSYDAWSRVDHANAPSALLGPAHQGNDPEYTRTVYTNASGQPATEYPEGTAYVKETYTHDAQGNRQLADPMGLLGMVKRAPGFDDDGNDWEYAVLDPSDLSVMDSGPNLGSCKGCHSLATGSEGRDFIFAHPQEHVTESADFDDYATWHLIGTEQGPDDFIGGAHEGNDEDAVRRIYKKQLAANPAGGGYPTGTMLVKDVRDGDGGLIGRTGMVKRGGDFDPDNGNWEYYMWDPASGDVMAQGAVAMCIGCHSVASSPAAGGADFVFPHDGDPFNN